jgi:L-ascorbate metabolism protein UlaG (beta-lactamase superfamily)
MGDTGVFADMRLIADLYHPDLVLIPIGGHYVLDPTLAAMVVRDWIKPKYAFPIHYGTTPQLRGTPQELLSAMGGATAPRILVPQPGEKYAF